MKNLQKITSLLLALALLAGCGAGASSASSSATPTPTPTAEPTPEPTPAQSVSFNPLTGTTEADFTGCRPVAVTLRTIYGAQPQWGIAAADVLVQGVSVGTTPGMLALYGSADKIGRAGPVGEASDLLLQFALPLNAVPVHIGKNVYASNLLNTLAYQDVDGLHVGKTAFAFDTDRQLAGYREENCFYTTADGVRAGLEFYGASANGENAPLFRFAQDPAALPETQNGTTLSIAFSPDGTDQLVYDAGTSRYTKLNIDGTPLTDAETGEAAQFTNVFVLYASSGIKDDGYTRQYDMTGGTGLYLHGGAWEQISWSKEDATGPFSLTAADGTPLTVAPGKSFIAIWGGYYGQALRLTAADGSEQTLPEKPTLLASGVTDEAAAAAEAALSNAQKLIDAQAAIDQANASLAEAQTELQDAQAALDADSENADLLAARDAAQAKIDELNQTIADNQAYLDANAPQPEETTQPEATEAPAE